MDNVQQIYSDKEDDIITSGLGLLSGMDMEGAITFKNFKTTFSTTKFLMGFFNSKSGDVYAKSALTLRGNHSLVAARMTNFFHHCKNPAFTRSKEHAAVEESYLEVPNSHSAIYRKHYRFPPPLTDREGINKIVWKRLTDDSIVVVYHPLLSHPKVEAKDGKVLIRALIQITIHVKQLDDATTEVNMGYHMRVRVCEERSDERRRRVFWISTQMHMADSSLRNVTAAYFFAISNVMNAPYFATFFARRSLEEMLQRLSSMDLSFRT